MLRAVPTGWLSWSYQIFDGERALCTLDSQFGRDRGGFVLDGSRFEIHREPRWGDFVLGTDAGEVARATKTNVMTRHFKVRTDETSYELDGVSVFNRGFALRHEGSRGGMQIGKLRPDRFLSRTVLVELPDTIPAAVQIFLLWLVILIWHRQAAS